MPFYVGERFNEEFTGNNLKNVERSVEEDYISNLRNNCWKEKQQSGFSILRVHLDSFNEQRGHFKVINILDVTI